MRTMASIDVSLWKSINFLYPYKGRKFRDHSNIAPERLNETTFFVCYTGARYKNVGPTKFLKDATLSLNLTAAYSINNSSPIVFNVRVRVAKKNGVEKLIALQNPRTSICTINKLGIGNDLGKVESLPFDMPLKAHRPS